MLLLMMLTRCRDASCAYADYDTLMMLLMMPAYAMPPMLMPIRADAVITPCHDATLSFLLLMSAAMIIDAMMLIHAAMPR